MVKKYLYFLVAILWVNSNAFSQICDFNGCVSTAARILTSYPLDPLTNNGFNIELNRTNATKATNVSSYSVKYFYTYREVGGTDQTTGAWSNLLTTKLRLKPGTSYVFSVRTEATCTDSFDGSPGCDDIYSAETAPVLTFPASPTLLESESVASSTAMSINFLWSPVQSATEYDIIVYDNNAYPVYQRTVTTASFLAGNLTANSVYFYKVRSRNPSGYSDFRSSGAISTKTVAPVLTAVTNVSTTGFTLNWNGVLGADNYTVDVSDKPDFSVSRGTITKATPTSVSASVAGLNPGVLYYYRVSAHNVSGFSDYSSSNIMTKPLAPGALSAIQILFNTFTARWQQTIGAAQYELDVSTDQDFLAGTYVTGFNNLVIDGSVTQKAVIGLSPGVTYYYRVRARNSGGSSANSAVISQLTLPGTPSNFEISEHQTNSLKASWSAVASAVEYQLEVSTSQNFDSYLTGYSPKIISGDFTSQVVAGLTPATPYYFRIQARNSSGLSNFVTQTSSTLPEDGSNPASLSLDLPKFPTRHLNGGQTQITVKVTGGTGSRTAILYHKMCSEDKYTAHDMVPELPDGFSIMAQDFWFDSFGMDFYITAQDETGIPVVKEAADNSPFKIVTSVPNVLIPLTSFGRDVQNYQIISLPYQLDRSLVHDVFEQVVGLGTYDKKRWRLSRYEDGVIVDFDEGIGSRRIVQGDGYWFISRDNVALSLGQGDSYGNDISDPFVMVLKKGWNQIGNPFPYDLSWADILTVNGTAPVESTFYSFDKGFVDVDRIKVFGGGFVFAHEDTELTLPVTLREMAGGRSGGGLNTASWPNLAGDNRSEWLLPISLIQGSSVNNLSGIGMKSDASNGKDKYDRIAPPRFLQYPELKSKLSGIDYDLSRVVVAPADNYRWDFSIEGSRGEPVELRWDKASLNTIEGKVLMYDRTRKIVLDMSKFDIYSSSASAELSIYYLETVSLDQEMINLGIPYPNPFNHFTTIPYEFFPDSLESTEFIVYDVTGKVVFTKSVNEAEHAGIQSMVWDGHTDTGVPIPPGIYLYHLIIRKDGQLTHFDGRLIRN